MLRETRRAFGLFPSEFLARRARPNDPMTFRNPSSPNFTVKEATKSSIYYRRTCCSMARPEGLVWIVYKAIIYGWRLEISVYS